MPIHRGMPPAHEPPTTSPFAEIAGLLSAGAALPPEPPASPVLATSGLDVGSGTPEDRTEAGRAARTNCSRTSLGEYDVRADPQIAIDILAAQEKDRIQSLLPVRHERMRESAFTFYRGSSAVMAYDLARRPSTRLTVQLCGDAHLLNFGLYAAPDRFTVFDINDFDETHPGPFEWDVHRLLASLVLAAEDKGMTPSETRTAVLSAAHQYAATLRQYAAMPNLDAWYQRTTLAGLTTYVEQHHRPDLQTAIRASTRESERKSMWSAVKRFTELTPSGRVFRSDPPIIERLPMDSAIRDHIIEMFTQYKSTVPPARQVVLDRYEVVDIGHKVVGVGSVGLLAFVTLLQGRDDSDLLVLQSKQAVASVLEPYTSPSRFGNHGERVVVGQQILQPASDMFLGWYAGRGGGRHYYTRQMRDHKGSLDLRTLTPGVLASYGALCAATLARGHARSGDPIALAAYLGVGDKAAMGFARFAFAYRDQVHIDYRGWLTSS